MPDENSLAMVLAHEIAHIKHRDPIVSTRRGLLVRLVYGLLTGDTTFVAEVASDAGLLFFSREQEVVADMAAVEGLRSMYRHVGMATTFFKHDGAESEIDTRDG